MERKDCESGGIPGRGEGQFWLCRGRRVEFKSGALVMGILNVTPDSFSDGGRYADPEKAIARALQMDEEGADIIDVGGESSRPGAIPVEARAETDRVVPVIEALRSETDALISIDTVKSAVAEAALRAGADIINDISALEADPRMADVARDYRAGIVLMHKKGNPRDMQNDPRYGDVLSEVEEYLRGRMAQLEVLGLDAGAFVIDPGIGFGKTTEHNLKLIASVARLARLGRPVAVGVSRKRFLGELTGRAVNERAAASLAALAYCRLNGASVFRVHDVRESCDVLAVLRAICGERH